MLQIGSDKRWEGFTGLHYMTKISIILFDFQSESLIDLKEVFDSEPIIASFYQIRSFYLRSTITVSGLSCTTGLNHT